MMGTLLSSVLAYKLSPDWWSLDSIEQEKIIHEITHVLSSVKESGALKSEYYKSLRPDSSILLWLLAEPSELHTSTRARIEKAFGRHADLKHGFFSTYEHKQMKDPKNKPYFVAYPITKSTEWYLLDEKTRKEILSEHIGRATSDPNNNGINSYTTSSFGIDDNEFVVIYELPSLLSWVSVTQNLRSAKARKWIIKESPILVGEKGDLGSLTYSNSEVKT